VLTAVCSVLWALRCGQGILLHRAGKRGHFSEDGINKQFHMRDQMGKIQYVGRAAATKAVLSTKCIVFETAAHITTSHSIMFVGLIATLMRTHGSLLRALSLLRL
jgi:hypothetical protein